MAKKTKKVAPTTSQQIKAIPDKQTKVQILKVIAGETGLSLQHVRNVFLTANNLLKGHLTKKGSGEFTIPEMAIKVVRKTKAATKKRQGRNPLTGEAITIAAKAKREVIKIKPLKNLKSVLTPNK